ncbi:unnamed protein product [Rotaria magnacalcarata]|uniref:Uncharacterized protein n=1 Tax=Rotaria magnacalcarata TaxID=392030 RepID=A0A816SSW0_9BILA|nr:unnamed protein product [Rotaria magnacalcarata]
MQVKQKLDKKPTNPKGQRRVGQDLANYLTNTLQIFCNEDNFLCTPCYKSAKESLDTANVSTSVTPMDTDEYLSERAASIAALSNISRISNVSNLESRLNREKSFELLNNVFKVVGQLPIRDLRHRDYLRQKVNQVVHLIHPPLDKLDITIDDSAQIVNNLKYLIDVSDYSEKIKLLALASKNWGRLKIENFFLCSEHQARYRAYLRDDDQILCSPIDLRGNIAFDPIIEKAIYDFYHTDEISRASPNKKDVLQNNENPNPIRHMLMTLMTLMETYQQFIQNSSSMHVGKSKSCSLKPKWIKTITLHDI